MKKVLPIITFFVSAASLLAGCSVSEPLSKDEQNSVAGSIEKPQAFTKLSKESSADFQDAYGDQERLDPSFENLSDECEAVVDLARLPRWGAGGNDYRKFLPSELRGFEDMSGWSWSTETSDEAESYSYAQVEVALLSFESEEEALAYTSVISDNVEDCYDFREDANDILKAQELTRFTPSEEHAPDFSFEYTFYLESSGFFDIQLATDYGVGVFHYGPNVAFVLAASDEDSQGELGISTSDLVDGFDDLRILIGEAIEQAQDVGSANA